MLSPKGPAQKYRAFIAFGLLLLTGCSAVISVSEYPFKQIATFIETETGEEKPVLSPVEVENDLMRFADNLIAGASGAYGQLKTQGAAPDPAVALKLQISFLQDVYAVATGPNPYGNLLDMVTLVTLSRIQLENYWIPNRWEDSAYPY